jgi:hypothetical protein
VTRYIGLAEFFWLAEQVTGLPTTTLVNASRVELADSALHAPQAGYGAEDFYPDIYDKSAVLTCRLAWNHPLPDGNKRAAWACLLLSVARIEITVLPGGSGVRMEYEVLSAEGGRVHDEHAVLARSPAGVVLITAHSHAGVVTVLDETERGASRPARAARHSRWPSAWKCPSPVAWCTRGRTRPRGRRSLSATWAR